MVENINCFGCGACENICEYDAISMEYDQKGFYLPSINKDKCVGCNKCENVCPINDINDIPNRMMQTYFFVNKDIYDRNVSSSGGFIKALADYVFDNNGICFGASFDDDLSVHHVEVKNRENIYSILGSKYVQSKTGKTFQAVKKHLDAGRMVMYTGTPCQIAGLKSFLGHKEYKNLITVDIFCHGVPSPKLWKKYLSQYYKDKEIRYVQFRDKSLGWWQFRFRIQFAHDEYASLYRPPKDDYIKLFLQDISINDRCLACPYRTKEKYSDFYIGDAWNINKVKRNIDDNHGATTVIVNSERGEQIIKQIWEKHHIFKVSMEDGVYSREELFQTKIESENRIKFWGECNKVGIKETMSKLDL